MKKLAALGEFGWLKKLLPRLYWPASLHTQLWIGPGDDAGVLRISPGKVLVATTDAIAATSIAKRIGLPQRIVDILEGESLVNDATGLLALEFAVAILVSGQTPTVGAGLLRLAYLTIAGLALGLLVGFVVARIHKLIDDGPIEITLTLLVPYMAYLAAVLPPELNPQYSV